MHFVYLLRCSDGSYYAGYTTDVDRRLGLHQRGRAARYTRTRRPVTLVYVEACESRSAALRREAELKRMRREEKEKLARTSRTVPDADRQPGGHHA
jgi:putative endonuclease